MHPFRLFPEPSPLARADFASSPPRRTPASRAFHGRRGSLVYSRLSYPVATTAAPRRDSADSAVRWNEVEGRKDREIRATKRVLKFRRLHLVHSSAVAAQQTVAVTALILEFSLSLPHLSLSRLHPLRFLFSFSCFFFFLLSFLALGEPADFSTKNLCPLRYWILIREVCSAILYTRVLPNILLQNIFARKIAHIFFLYPIYDPVKVQRNIISLLSKE